MPVGLTANDVSSAIEVLTAKSASCQGPANQLNVINIALAVAGMGPIVIARLSDIISTVTATISQLNGTQPFTDKSEEDAIVDAWKWFVEVHQNLLNILIGKSGLVPNLIPFVGPTFTSAFRQLESVVDTLAFELVDRLPDNKDEVTAKTKSLDETFAAAIKVWNELPPPV